MKLRPPKCEHLSETVPDKQARTVDRLRVREDALDRGSNFRTNLQELHLHPNHSFCEREVPFIESDEGGSQQQG